MDTCGKCLKECDEFSSLIVKPSRKKPMRLCPRCAQPWEQMIEAVWEDTEENEGESC